MLKITNEDGTEIHLPPNPLKNKWAELYPSIPSPQNSQTCDGYSCMWCGRCPKGDNWTIPAEDKAIWDEYQKQIRAYYAEHNPSLAKLLYTNNHAKDV